MESWSHGTCRGLLSILKLCNKKLTMCNKNAASLWNTLSIDIKNALNIVCFKKKNLKTHLKQGAVISPLLFSIYIDNLFKELKQLGLGCHVGPTFAGAFGYADDVALIAPSLYALKK